MMPDTAPEAPTVVKLASTVLERLKTEFEIEFSRKPLADAFSYLGEETQVEFVIDGDALKMAGYTKNMPQTFSLGKAPGTKGIYTILTWPMQEKLCLVIDDAKMQALITTTAAAAPAARLIASSRNSGTRKIAMREKAAFRSIGLRLYGCPRNIVDKR